jgi:AGCS family alanine or glycine:cation symporter
MIIDVLPFFTHLNYLLAMPTAMILLGVAIYLTLSLKFIQFTSIPRFFALIVDGVKTQRSSKNKNAISPFSALFTAMSTSLGMGTIVGPSIAILMGGPGALFWLIFYAICASVIKFAEVTFAVQFRKRTDEGLILGGPMAYLSKVSPFLERWYAYATIILFAGWSGVQSNVLAETLAQESIPEWITGFILAFLVFIMLNGGAQRIGALSSKLVPCMTSLYLIACFLVLYINRSRLISSFSLMFQYAFSPSPFFGAFAGATAFAALRAGVYKGAYITESGMGTAAIPHSMADVERPTDQGILAMISVFADTFLCLLSGLLVLSTDVWHTDLISNTLIYKVFQISMPLFGKPILLLTLILFVSSTVIGNSFNGRQSFASITHYRWLIAYYAFICLVIFVGAISDVPLVWTIIDLLTPLVAIPNVLSILFLSTTHRQFLQR